MTECILTFGSNCPERERMMELAGRWIDSTFGPAVSSGVYSTRALNGKSPDYLNMVVCVATELTAEQLIFLGKEFERRCGRSPESKLSGVVEMDVDLVKFGSVILRPEEFTRAYFMTGYERISAKKL